MNTAFLSTAIQQFEYYKLLGEKTFVQLPDDALFWQYNRESNNIATIVNHLWGNLLSRWTDFLTTDGEKPWRDRDGEFEHTLSTRSDILAKWEEGWQILLQTLRTLQPEDLEQVVYIRNQGHTVTEAIQRQLAHYAYHVGQIVYIGKMQAQQWSTLSIARDASRQFNDEKFSLPPHREHFTTEALKNGNRIKS